MAKTLAPAAVELAKVIAALRQQLIQSQEEGKDSSVRFNVAEAEIEIQFAVTKEAEAKGGVNFWVYEAGGAGKLASASMQTLRIKLLPTTPDGGPLNISSRGRRSS